MILLGMLLLVVQPPITEDAVRDAFVASHQGYSVDELLARDELRDDFVESIQTANPTAREDEALAALLNLRKRGRLEIKTTRRAPEIDQSLLPAAEIAARTVMDRHRISSDRLLIDPVARNEFEEAVRKLLPDADLDGARRAVLRLRKNRRLQPELVLRVADWTRTIEVYSLAQVADRPALISTGPGVYLFRDATGYLYIGEAANVRKRIAEHLSESDRPALASFLSRSRPEAVTIEVHAFAEDSPARRVRVRRAYESEMIASRNPRFNIRP